MDQQAELGQAICEAAYLEGDFLLLSPETVLPGNSTTRIAAYGLVLKQHRILLCRISARITEHAGLWTLPGGGIDFGEDPEYAMVREVHEETGLIVRSVGVAGVDSLLVPDGNSATHSLRIIYFTEVLGGSLTHEVDGSTDLCEWHHVDAARSLPIVDLVESSLELVKPDS